MDTTKKRLELIDYDHGRGGEGEIEQWEAGEHGANALLCRHVLGWRNIRRNRRRGLVGEPASARDGRGIWSVLRFGDLSEAWKLLNAFANSRDVEAQHIFYQTIARTGVEYPHWCDFTMPEGDIAARIATAALTVTVHLLETRGYVL
jgi:hypothetical protein